MDRTFIRSLGPGLLILTGFCVACGDTPTNVVPDRLDADAVPVVATFDAAGVTASAVGNGHFAALGEAVNSFSFNALKKADGTVKGEATLQIRLFDTCWKLDVDCLAMSGNVAVLSGEVSHTNTPYVGWGLWLAVEDNGEGENAVPDRITGAYDTRPDFLGDPDYCHKVIQDIDAYLAPFPVKWNEVIRGNVQVKGG